MFWKKQREVEKSVEEYITETEKCVAAFEQAFEVYFTEGISLKFEEFRKQTHRAESKADDLRREIERTMYGKALIPAFRGDILGMIEDIDKVPNECDSVLNQIGMQGMAPVPEYIEDMKELVKVNIESYRLLCRGVEHVFDDINEVLPAMDLVDAKESASDKIERKLIKAVFDSAMDKADKILLKELILEIGSISDKAENAADRISIIAIKQQLG